MKINIDEMSFENNGEYLDVTIHLEKYLTLKIDGEYSMDEKDWKIIKKEIDKIFKNLNK